MSDSKTVEAASRATFRAFLGNKNNCQSEYWAPPYWI